MKGLRQGDITSNRQQFDIEIAQRVKCVEVWLVDFWI